MSKACISPPCLCQYASHVAHQPCLGVAGHMTPIARTVVPVHWLAVHHTDMRRAQEDALKKCILNIHMAIF